MTASSIDGRQRNPGGEGLALAAMCSALAAAYLATMPPGYTFEDTALFAAACASGGVAQPPGYPFYALTCAPFAQLAGLLGFSPAQGAAVASAAAAVGACWCLALLLLRTTGHGAAAVLGAGAFGLSLTFWSQAIIQEAYALNALLFLGSLLLLDTYVRGGSRWLLAWAALLAGFGLANHWPLFVLAAPTLALWLAPAARRLVQDLRGKLLLACLLALALGLAPYLHMLFPRPHSAALLGSSLPDGFVDYVTREQFGGFDAAAQHPRWDERFRNASLTLLGMLREFTWIGGLLFLGGLTLALRRLGAWRTAALAWGWLGVTFALALYRPYLAESELSAKVFANYGMTAYALSSFPLALAASWLAERYRVAVRLQWAAVAVALAALAVFHGMRVYRGADDLAMRYAQLLRDEVPADALLLIGHGNYDFPLAYDSFLSYGSGSLAPEVAQLYLDRVGERPPLAALPHYVGQEARPVVLSSRVPYDYSQASFHGAYFRANYDRSGPMMDLSPAARDFLRRALVLRDAGNNAWTTRFADQLLYRFALTAMLERRKANELEPEAAVLLEEVEASLPGRYAKFLVDSSPSQEGVEPPGMAGLLKGLGDLAELPVDWRADVHWIVARRQVAEGRLRPALATLEQALREYPSAGNSKVLQLLLSLHAHLGDFEAYAHVRRRYPGLDASGLEGLDSRCASFLGKPCDR